jgi:hypothetical protein
MAINISFQNPSFTQALKVTELRLHTDEKTGKSHYKRENTRIVQRKGQSGSNGVDDHVNIWLDTGNVKIEIEALPA